MNRRSLWIAVLFVMGSALLGLWLRWTDERGPTPRDGNTSPPAVAPTPRALEPASLEAPEPSGSKAEHERVDASVVPSSPNASMAAPEDSFELAGRVVDDEGQPVTWFRVAASPAGKPANGGVRLADSNSSPDGSFRVAGLRRGQWELTARDRGERRSAPVVVSVPDESADVVLMLPRGATVAGVVVDPGGRPVSGAELHVGDSDQSYLRELRHETRATTDASGRFRIEDLLPGKVFLMASNAQGVESDWLEVAAAPGAAREDVRIELGTGGRIEGSVDMALGQIAHRKVNLYSFRGSSGWRNAETDERGRFAIEGVIPQKYVIELRQETEENGIRVAKEELRKNITVEDGQTTEVVFGAPARWIRVHGRLTSVGQPVPGAEVRAHPEEGDENARARAQADLDGRYELTVSGAGNYRFQISLNDGSRAVFERAVPDQDELELSFELPSGSISGRVVGDDGRPLARVPITLLRTGSKDWESFYRDDYRRMQTADDGAFAFRLLAPGAYTLRAPDGLQEDSPRARIAFGRAVQSDLVIGPGTALADVELRLPPEGRIAGVVVDARGNGVGGASIWVQDARGLWLSGRWETHSDPTGHFEVENVGPGRYTVAARGNGLEAVGPTVQVEAGETASTRIELR